MLVRKLRFWLNSKLKKKLIRLKKGNEHIYYEIVQHVPFRVRKKTKIILDNSKYI